MAKNTSKKIKELRGEKPTKISNDHLNKMQTIINNLNRGQLEIGSLETRKHALLKHVASFQEELSSMQEELKKDYGTDNINIHTGEIITDEQAD
jgi:hypothetical protein|tara:strand:- start:74 stop:355 length:282 start_codon:yes stop_codon:yes gene_type:complete